MWNSKTGMFTPGDMAQFESASLEELYALLLRDDPVVAMRTLTELRLNGSRHLNALLADPILTSHWLQWPLDRQLHTNDEEWAKALQR